MRSTRETASTAAKVSVIIECEMQVKFFFFFSFKSKAILQSFVESRICSNATGLCYDCALSANRQTCELSVLSWLSDKWIGTLDFDVAIICTYSTVQYGYKKHSNTNKNRFFHVLNISEQQKGKKNLRNWINKGNSLAITFQRVNFHTNIYLYSECLGVFVFQKSTLDENKFTPKLQIFLLLRK